MTNRHRLSIEANHSPEILERLLRTVRHRGFGLIECSMQYRAQAPNQILIQLEVESERPIEQLKRQLLKLWDISQVHLLNHTELNGL